MAPFHLRRTAGHIDERTFLTILPVDSIVRSQVRQTKISNRPLRQLTLGLPADKKLESPDDTVTLTPLEKETRFPASASL